MSDCPFELERGEVVDHFATVLEDGALYAWSGEGACCFEVAGFRSADPAMPIEVYVVDGVPLDAEFKTFIRGGFSLYSEYDDDGSVVGSYSFPYGDWIAYKVGDVAIFARG